MTLKTKKWKSIGFGLGYQTLKKQKQISLTILDWKNQIRNNLIYSLYDKNGDISAGTDEVLATSKEFYPDLYVKEGVDTIHKTKFLNP